MLNVQVLLLCSVALGYEKMLTILIGFPAVVEKLLPLVTALQLECGQTPRVAQEVMEVAEDIRRDLAQLSK